GEQRFEAIDHANASAVGDADRAGPGPGDHGRSRWAGFGHEGEGDHETVARALEPVVADVARGAPDERRPIERHGFLRTGRNRGEAGLAHTAALETTIAQARV